MIASTIIITLVIIAQLTNKKKNNNNNNNVMSPLIKGEINKMRQTAPTHPHPCNTQGWLQMKSTEVNILNFSQKLGGLLWQDCFESNMKGNIPRHLRTAVKYTITYKKIQLDTGRYKKIQGIQ